MKKWVGLAVLLGILILAFVLKDIHFYEVLKLLKNLNPGYFFLAFLCSLLSFLVLNAKFIALVKETFKIEYFFSLAVLFAGSFLNILTPGAGVGGEPIKAFFLNKRYKISKTKVFGIIGADKFFQLMVFSFFLLFSILFLLFFINIPKNLKFTLEIILFITLFLFGVFIFLNIKTINFNPGFFFKVFYGLWFIKSKFSSSREFEKFINSKAQIFFRAFKKISKTRKNFFYGIFYSILFYIFVYLLSWFLFLSFGYSVNFLSIIIVVTLGMLIGEISPVPGGVGVTESTMFLLYNAMGISFSLAVIVALFSRLIHYFFSFIVGGLSLVYLEQFLGKNGSR